MSAPDTSVLPKRISLSAFMATLPLIQAFYSPFEFFPQPNQDAELLKLIGFIPGAKELLTLRQVHALEHATVSVLGKLQRTQHPLRSATDTPDLSGFSTEQGFYLYGDVKTTALHQAVRVALRRLISGDWALAIHPQCGTNASVHLLASVSSSLGLTAFMPVQITQQITQHLIAVGLCPYPLTQPLPTLGDFLQQYVTTAIPFNLAIEAIHVLEPSKGVPQHFVNVRWIDDASLGDQW
jgi:precorrin-4 methylase